MNAHPNPCRIIGVLDNGVDGLTPEALGHLRRADLVIGGTRTLALFAKEFAGAETRDLTGTLSQAPDWIRDAQAKGGRVVVLATGDPLCHGIAGFLQARLCIESCEVLPNVSMVQLACARLGIPWQDMKILSAHGPDTGEWPTDEWPNRSQSGAGPEHGLYSLLRAVVRHDRLAIYTSPDNTPDRIARLLVAEGLADDFQLAVAERLLRVDERVIADCSVQEAAVRRFADPNLLLLWRDAPRPREVLFGLADETYRQRRPDKGLITGREVRAVSLARLQLRANSIVWDIGAGSGSVGLEAARLCPEGHVYAMEKNAEDLANCAQNRQQLHVTNHTLRHGKAPTGLDDWPAPDAVFIGGSGGELAELIRLCLTRLKPDGRLIMNFVTFENLTLAIGVLQEMRATWDVTQLNVSRSRPILDMHRLAAENPVWVVCVQPNHEKTEISLNQENGVT
uniref:Precorrin-6Y C5,15-methyltransferase (Decarboxylating) n=1 Tax=Candidatus Kentrum sp. MB TaxID=2138164 RepID=A0A450XRT9_9GAMM|nr:MAG: precorrin-6Y C5,15-methyltransferase (decarboxylating) [Candidatus Kentron sp. MB]